MGRWMELKGWMENKGEGGNGGMGWRSEEKKVEKQSDEEEIERMEDRAGVTAEEEIE